MTHVTFVKRGLVEYARPILLSVHDQELTSFLPQALRKRGPRGFICLPRLAKQRVSGRLGGALSRTLTLSLCLIVVMLPLPPSVTDIQNTLQATGNLETDASVGGSLASCLSGHQHFLEMASRCGRRTCVLGEGVVTGMRIAGGSLREAIVDDKART